MIEQRGLSRRRFLAVAVAGAAVGSVLVGRHQLASWTYPASPWPHLDERTAGVLGQLGSIWLPGANPAFPAPEAVPYLASLDHAFALLPDHLAEQVVDGIQAFDWAAIVYGWYRRPFSVLDASEAHAYVQRWVQGRPEQRALVAALRQLVCVAYWGQAQTWPATGYRGPLHQRSSIPSLGDAPEPPRL